MQDLSDSEDINRAWENFKENIKTSAKEGLGLLELKQHKPWSDQEYLGYIDQRKKAKIQRLQDPSQSNVGNPNNVRRKASLHSRDKKKEYLVAKIEEPESNSKIKILGTC